MQQKSRGAAFCLIAAIAFTPVAMPSLAASVPGQGTWESSLQPRDLDGNGSVDAFFDASLNITWLRDAGKADGRPWSELVGWADTFQIGAYTNWRLPTMIDSQAPGCDASFNGTDCGYNVQTAVAGTVFSEMAHLYYVTLGNLGARDTDGDTRPGDLGVDWGLVNTGAFQNLQAGLYWTGLDYAPNASFAWSFDMSVGRQGADVKDVDRLGVFAVHEGSIGTPVPEPGSRALMLLGTLGGAVLFLRRRKAGEQVHVTNAHSG